MAREAVYVVRSTLNPGVAYRTNRAEYEHLLELGVLSSLDEVIAPRELITISGTELPAPLVGDIWFNPNIPA